MSPLALIIVGLILTFLAFAFVAVNMYRGVTDTSSSRGFVSMIGGHIGAMIVMALGGLVFTIGLVWGIFQLLS